MEPLKRFWKRKRTFQRLPLKNIWGSKSGFPVQTNDRTRINIWINLEDFISLMSYAKIQPHIVLGSRAEKMNKPQRAKTYPKENSNQLAHPPTPLVVWSEYLLSVKETLHPWVSKIRLVRILIKLRKCASWPQSLHGAHVRSYVFSP